MKKTLTIIALTFAISLSAFADEPIQEATTEPVPTPTPTPIPEQTQVEELSPIEIILQILVCQGYPICEL